MPTLLAVDPSAGRGTEFGLEPLALRKVGDRFDWAPSIGKVSNEVHCGYYRLLYQMGGG